MWYLIHHKMSDEHRFPIGPSPTEPKLLRASLFPLEDVRLTDVARWLDELQKAGAIAVRNSERGWYGETAEQLRYRAEDFAKGAPRYGPRLEKPADQPLLPLGPVSVIRSVPVTPARSKPYDSDYGNGDVNDSTRAAVASDGESRNRALSSGDGPERFARDPDVLQSTKLGKRWGRFLGMSQVIEEARRSGAEWARIMNEEGEALDQDIPFRAEMPAKQPL